MTEARRAADAGLVQAMAHLRAAATLLSTHPSQELAQARVVQALTAIVQAREDLGFDDADPEEVHSPVTRARQRRPSRALLPATPRPAKRPAGGQPGPQRDGGRHIRLRKPPWPIPPA